MRLTLRTLLSYLDDTLEPAQAKLIGQKIAESEVAQQLIKRIKEVTRRQDLPVPPSSGPDAPIDLNVVAEYLDNALSPEKAAEVEEVSQNADTYLAELAACHQILSLLAAEPAKVSASARERMHALTRGRAAAKRAGVAAAARADGSAAPVEEAEAASEESSGPRRFAPLLGAVAVLIAIALIIWRALPEGTGPKPDNQVALNTDTGPAPRPESPATPASNPAATGNSKPVVEKPEPEKPVDPPEAAGQDVPSKDRRELGKFQPVAKAPGSVLVTRPADSETWDLVPAMGAVYSTQPLVSLPGSRSMVQLNGVGMELWGNLPEFISLEALRKRQAMPVVESAVTLHAPRAPHDADFTLQEGRVVLSNTRPEGEVRVHVRFQGQVWDLTLTEPGTEVSLEACGRYLNDTQFSKQPSSDDGPLEEVLFMVLKGEASLRFNFNVYNLPGSSLFYWNNRLPAPGGVRPFPQPPYWYNQALPDDAKELSAAVQELSARCARADATIAVVLAEFLDDANLARRMLALYCLGAIDALPPLVDALEGKRMDVRQMAIQILRHWIGVIGDRDLVLYKFLQAKKGYSEQQAQDIMILLHSFSDEARALPETFDHLISYLLHEKVAIRELANWHLTRMVPAGTKLPPFDAGSGTDQRIAAYKAWKELIPDGKLPMRPNP